MRRVYFAVLPVLSLILGIPSSPSRITASEPSPAGNVIFEDDFNRDESTPDKEEIGNGWTTNRAWRANGKKQVDLAEYATNLRGSGVHGALLVHETRFGDDLMAAILSIPPAKTLLRRHLSIHFKVLLCNRNHVLSL